MMKKLNILPSPVVNGDHSPNGAAATGGGCSGSGSGSNGRGDSNGIEESKLHENKRAIALEKSQQSMIAILQREAIKLKQTIELQGQQQKKLEGELNKRESFIQIQIHQLKDLKKKYEDLNEVHKELMIVFTTLTKERPVIVKPKPPSPSPLLPPQVIINPVTLPIQPKSAILANDDDNDAEEEEGIEVHSSSDMTFLTSHNPTTF
eukprot:scaffold650_cov201-Ochromonas_danica.AAC.2